MPSRKFLRIFGPTVSLAVLAAITALVTKSVIDSRASAAPPPQRKSTPLKITSNPQVKVDSLTPVPGGIAVAASASLLNELNDQELGWYVKAYRKTDKVPAGGGTDWELVKELEYDHQKFKVTKGEPSLPTFKEQLAVPQGLYQVEVGLVEYGVTHLSADGEEKDPPHTLVSNVNVVTVQ